MLTDGSAVSRASGSLMRTNGPVGTPLASKVRALCEGRFHVAFEDVEAMLLPAFRHRLILNFEGEAEGVVADDLIRELARAVPQIPDEVSSLV